MSWHLIEFAVSRMWRVLSAEAVVAVVWTVLARLF